MHTCHKDETAKAPVVCWRLGKGYYVRKDQSSQSFLQIPLAVRWEKVLRLGILISFFPSQPFWCKGKKGGYQRPINRPQEYWLSLTLITLSQFKITEMAKICLITLLVISEDLFQNRDAKSSRQEASTLKPDLQTMITPKIIVPNHPLL